MHCTVVELAGKLSNHFWEDLNSLSEMMRLTTTFVDCFKGLIDCILYPDTLSELYRMELILALLCFSLTTSLFSEEPEFFPHANYRLIRSHYHSLVPSPLMKNSCLQTSITSLYEKVIYIR